MNLFDIGILVILGFCLIRGGFRGLIKEMSAIIGVFGGFYGAYTYYPLVAKLLSRWMSDAGYSNILAFLIIFAIIQSGYWPDYWPDYWRVFAFHRLSAE